MVNAILHHLVPQSSAPRLKNARVLRIQVGVGEVIVRDHVLSAVREVLCILPSRRDAIDLLADDDPGSGAL